MKEAIAKEDFVKFESARVRFSNIFKRNIIENELEMLCKDICTTFYLYRCVTYEACLIEKFDSTVKNEGNSLGTVNWSNLDICIDKCDNKWGCKSFGYCPKETTGTCYLRDKQLSGSEETVKRDDKCYSVFRQCQDST